MRRTAIAVLSLWFCLNAGNTWSQESEFGRKPFISFFTGIINYQGDLNPNSFTFGRSQFTAGASIRMPLSRWFSAKAGFNIGSLEAADRYNRDYLQPRNLSFFTGIKEVYAALELSLLNIERTRFTPYLYGGIAVFQFNPWAYDNAGEKVYLQPLSTEGQGLPDFPSQKPYKLTQFSLPFGAGIKYAVNDNVHIGVELSQRKTFTDYLDDVSSFYVDRDKLMAAKGPKAVEMAFRGLSSPTASAPYPSHGEQRGTPSEMDWYYFAGINIEVKLNALGALFRKSSRDKSYHQRCPKSVL
ncbi:MAG: hypothetical protein JNK14_09475 [Chitinophagaceae bacterium]|nr:hypothetical protein [Chitinophagaceae bacterium]